MMATVERASTPATTAPAAVRVTRSQRPAAWTAVLIVATVALLALLPLLVDPGTTDSLVNFFILLTAASMWNLLAGYAGLVSVGQQVFIGLGAYLVLILAQEGVNPYLAIPLAVVGCALAALPISWLVFRLRGGYFAIATWVVADAAQLVVGHFPSLGGFTGTALPGLASLAPTDFTTFTYWSSLAVSIVGIGAVYVLLRGRLGLVLTAVRDDEIGARSVGARVGRAKRIVYLVAAAGCGGAGSVLVISELSVQPGSAFAVDWAAKMIFVTVIGGIGTIEGPILGTVIFFVLQQTLAEQGALYLIVLGAFAIVVALWAPRGLWGLVASRLRLRLFPVGYWVWPSVVAGVSGEPRGRDRT